MSEEATSGPDPRIVRSIVEAAIRIGLLFLLAAFSLKILSPFINLVLWASIIAVAIYPLFQWLTRKLGGRTKMASAVFVLVSLALILVPSFLFFGEAIEESKAVSARLEAGTLSIPPPSPQVREWPVIGAEAYDLWSRASRDLAETLSTYEAQVQAAVKWGLGAIGGLGGTVLQFVLSVLIAGLLLANAGPAVKGVTAVASRFFGQDATEMVVLAEKTIRSVTVGVIGIAVIQSILSLIGMAIIGVPLASLWALLVLVLAIVQLPPILVLGPVMVYAFAAKSTTAAIFFLIYGLLVSGSDAVLKPLLLGRGVDVPMLVILLGAIGGMIAYGIIGLFVGAVVLAVAYQLFVAWVIEGTASEGAAGAEVGEVPAEA
ncbi:MAG: AI-2E family transporter [marine benthic group bacterium]|nr:AI-2E family transporter [Gemmatimonadota bacterium]